MILEKIKYMYDIGEYIVRTGAFSYYYGKLNHLPNNLLEEKKG